MKEYYYRNDIGYMKKIVVATTPNENGKYNFTLWNAQTGDFCGQGEKTKEDVEDFLKHYKIQDVFNV